jgi:hypothetical protein
MKTAILALALFGCSLEQGVVVESSKTERFNIAPLESIVYDVPNGAVDWRLAGNPNRSASPFVETMWYSLADGDNIDFFRGDEIYAQRLVAVPVGNAKVLNVDNAGGAPVAGAIVWTIQDIR